MRKWLNVSRSKRKVSSSRIKVSPRVRYSPKGRRRNVYPDTEDIHSSEKLVKTFKDEELVRRPSSEELETFVLRSESDETSFRYVTRNSYRKKPTGYVTKEHAADKTKLPQYDMQHPSTRDVRCQMTTHYVIQSQSNQRIPLRNKQTIRLQTGICKSANTQRLLSDDNPLCYTVAVETGKQNQLTQTKPQVVIPPLDISSSRTSTPPTLLSPRNKSPDNIEVLITNDFKSLYPESHQNESQKYIDSTLTTDTVEPPTETLESPSESAESSSESFEPDSFDGFKPNIVSKPQKIVTVGGGWNTMDDYMERHDPVQGLVYGREHLINYDLPENKKKYYGFKSNYKYPQYKTPYHFYKSKPFFRKLTNDG
ncbi:unnamed protein product [Mytilus edulis]|uniref:GAR domain-containing protein n=1 Tax=Mytilus edulis TaxID=6550 RepID=A0A8S3RCZ2_MYTED|nr:unnamed protein product [Mytilus edulis]